MTKLKIIKIGKSVGTIFPKEFGLKENDELKAEVINNQIIIDTEEMKQKHDRDLIENSFTEFEKENKFITQDEMIARFNQWGWGL